MSIVSAEQLRQFHEEGYMILEAVMSKEQLEGLRDETDRYISLIHQEMDEKKTDTIGLNHRNSRYFVYNQHRKSQILTDFLFSDLMYDVSTSTLGENVYLFHEQYVIKAAEKGSKFSWHQDSGYLGHDHKDYLTCWCPLDDVNEENGTVYVLPYSRAGSRDLVKHVQEEGSNDLVGYFGDDPGIPVVCPAGSVVAFSSKLFHRSGFNRTSKMRRVYLPQYSSEVIMNAEGTKPWAFDIPFVKDGNRVAFPGTYKAEETHTPV
ncbi:MAG: phytanoyl-CoA dioxygenase family protein [Verrucomicrobiota bacterium]|nr:phytanoyl-CoA dioxygenase family protein [Verrucomicrobiota bacterium]